METKELIKLITNKRRMRQNVAYRFALFDYMYSNGISVEHISDIFGFTRRSVYVGINKHRDLIKVGDKLAQRAQSEISQHRIAVKPSLVLNGNIYIAPARNKVLIDNKQVK